MGWNWLGVFAAQDALVDLGAAPYDGAGLADQFLAPLWQATTSAGRLLAVPWMVYPALFYYRADLLAAAGVAAEPADLATQITSWESFVALAQQVQQATPGVALFEDPSAMFWPMVHQQPGGWIVDGRNQLAARTSQAAALTAQVRALQLDARSMGNTDFDASLRQGTLAGVIADPGMRAYLPTAFPEQRGQWRVLRLPGAGVTFSATYLGIPTQSAHPEAAWALARFLAADATQQNAFRQRTGAIPALTSAWSSPEYDVPDPFFGGIAVDRVLARVAAEMPAFSVSPYDRIARKAVDDALDSMLTDSTDPAQAMQQAEEAFLREAPELLR